MGFFDDLGKTLKQGLDAATKKSGELAQAGKLRYDLYQANRDLETHYASLGKATFDNADALELSSKRAEIDKVKATIVRLEAELRDLGEDPHKPQVDADGRTVTVQPSAPSGELKPDGSSGVDLNK